MADNFYYSAPQTTQLKASSNTRQALLDTISPELTEKDINQAAERINSVYDQRRNDLRRKYADFPEMASAEETALERDRANDLARVSLDAKKSATDSTRSLLLNLENMDQSERRWKAQMDAAGAREMNAGLQQMRMNNMAKRQMDEERQMAMGGGYIDMQGNRSNRPNDGGRSKWVAENIGNARTPGQAGVPQVFQDYLDRINALGASNSVGMMAGQVGSGMGAGGRAGVGTGVTRGLSPRQRLLPNVNNTIMMAGRSQVPRPNFIPMGGRSVPRPNYRPMGTTLASSRPLPSGWR